MPTWWEIKIHSLRFLGTWVLKARLVATLHLPLDEVALPLHSNAPEVLSSCRAFRGQKRQVQCLATSHKTVRIGRLTG